jgi:hypothetical protein
MLSCKLGSITNSERVLYGNALMRGGYAMHRTAVAFAAAILAIVVDAPITHSQTINVYGTLDTPPTQSEAAGAQTVVVSKDDWNVCSDSSSDEAPSRCLQIIKRNNISKADRAVAYDLRCDWLLNRKRFDDALSDCNRGIAADGDVSLGYEGRGYLRFVSEDWKGSIEDFSRAIRLDAVLPGRTSFPFTSGKRLNLYYGYRSRAYQKLGSFQYALSDSERRVASEPTAAALGNHARILESLNRVDEARAAYLRALALDPNHASSKKGIERLGAQTNGAIPEYCIALGPPRPSSVGCVGGKQWYWTPVSIPKGLGCPSSIEIEYIDPDSQKMESFVIPERLQTCGAGVTTARIKQ